MPKEVSASRVVRRFAPVLPPEPPWACGRDEGGDVPTLPCHMTELGMGNGGQESVLVLGLRLPGGGDDGNQFQNSHSCPSGTHQGIPQTALPSCPGAAGVVVPATRHLPPALSRSAPAIQATWLSALIPSHSLPLCFNSHRIFKIRRVHNKMGISKFPLKPVRKSGSSLQLARSVPPIRAVCFAGRPHALSVCRVPGAILGV